MGKKLSIRDLDLKGKKLLVRVDFNVPLDDKGAISDSSRILAAIPTLRYALDQGASLILLSHMGRPKGKKDPSASLKLCVPELEKALHVPVRFLSDCIGDDVSKAVKHLSPGEVLLLENLRFHAAEEDPSKDPTFVSSLGALGDCYVNDAFGAAHRAHASVTELPKLFPACAAQGFLMEKEVQVLDTLLKDPARPFAALLGGAKASTKIPLIKALTERLDLLLIGGAMAYTFLQAQGFAMGGSLCEKECLSEANAVISRCQDKGIPLLLPIDIWVVPVGKPLNIEAARLVQIEDGVPDEEQGVDIGPATIELFTKALKDVKTVFWNGPVGVFEVPKFAKGTLAMANAVASVKGCSIVGGGDSLAAVQMSGLGAKMTHLSTGGGASLEYLEQGSLVGVDALSPYPSF